MSNRFQANRPQPWLATAAMSLLLLGACSEPAPDEQAARSPPRSRSLRMSIRP